MIKFAASDTELHVAHERWLAGRLKTSLGWDVSRSVSLGVYDRDGIRAVVLYHDWNPESQIMCMSAAAVGPWLNKEVLWRMHAYPFQCGCQAAVLQVSENNERMLRIAKAYGYELTRIPRLRGRDEAEVICVLTEEQWKANRFTQAYLKQQEKIARVAA